MKHLPLLLCGVLLIFSACADKEKSLQLKITVTLSDSLNVENLDGRLLLMFSRKEGGGQEGGQEGGW